MKKALITGITGQDGSYLAEFLLHKGYDVSATVRRTSSIDHPNIANVKNDIKFHYSDLTDSISVRSVIEKIQPDEIYNLAAQSHVGMSFEMPEITALTDAIGPLHILEAVRKSAPHTKLYQASTSEMFGLTSQWPQNEATAFYPGSPYGVAKLYAYWIMINYREGYNIFASNGILYNHESPRRGEQFVTRKITKAFANIAHGKQQVLELGNLDSWRDWGHAKDYVRAMWLMMQHDKPDDFVIATGKQHTVQDFCTMCADYFNIPIAWEGEGRDKVARNVVTGDIVIKTNDIYYRPVDIVNLLGDASKAKQLLNWEPEYTLQNLVEEMCEYDALAINAE